ncbi:MAG: DUF285 domain-containing protein, partial [Ekhidna sp.]|nr:DUF285 domain-containing protein [Ekhidna sp.]
MSTLNKKRPKDIMNKKNTSYTLPKGLYEPNLIPPPPYSIILSLKSTFLIISALFLAIFGQAQTEPEPKPFITTWETKTPNETIIIPTVSGENYNYSVKWGDGKADKNTYNGDASHSYTTADTYTVTITGTFPRTRFGEFKSGIFTALTAAGQIRSVKQWGDNQWTSMKRAFSSCNNLTIADEAGIPNLSNVTDMTSMFSISFFNGDLSEWDVSKVTNMEGMFNLSSFNQDISTWDVSKVKNMKGMFFQSSFNQDISTWDVSKVKNMEGMFFQSSFNQDISKWDISSVMNMSNMFFDNNSMSSENYDKLLIGWSTLDEAAGESEIPPGITFGAPNKYSCRGKAGRDVLTGTHSWTITGDELVPIRTDAASLSEVTSQCKVTANDLTTPTAKSSCTIGEGTTVTAAHDVSTFPITESTLITWTYTHNSKSIVQTQTVTITEDTTDPLPGMDLEALTVDCGEITSGDDLNLKAPTATDNCDGSIMGSHNITDFPITSEITITWT